MDAGATCCLYGNDDDLTMVDLAGALRIQISGCAFHVCER
jgi:hypothetical protein